MQTVSESIPKGTHHFYKVCPQPHRACKKWPVCQQINDYNLTSKASQPILYCFMKTLPRVVMQAHANQAQDRQVTDPVLYS